MPPSPFGGTRSGCTTPRMTSSPPGYWISCPGRKRYRAPWEPPSKGNSIGWQSSSGGALPPGEPTLK
eukprot:3780356-Heterocapsa_arctica.AAC.1